MRRLAPLLLLAAVALAQADSSAYLKLRAQNGVVQAVGKAAVRETKAPRVLELAGKPVSTCQVGDTSIVVLQFENGEEQEVEVAKMPEWLANTDGSVRLLVRCDKGGATLLAAAPAADVLPVEEAYWRRLAEKRRAEERRPAGSSVASRSMAVPRNAGLYGPIGRGSRRSSFSGSGVTPIYAAFIQGQNPRLPAAKAWEIARDLIGYSNQYGVPARLVVAILMVESGFDPNAVSHSGAVGLGQLMPDTARWMGVRNSYDTTQNLYGMIKLLNTHMRQFGRPADDPVVLAAYNAGEGAVRRAGGVPPYRETQAYVRRVKMYYDSLRSGD